MSTHRAVPEPTQAHRSHVEPMARPPGPRPSGRWGVRDVRAVQRLAGNRAAQVVVQRASPVVQRAAASWGTQAAAEATAAATRVRLGAPLLQHMSRHPQRTVRNTAELLGGSAPVVTLDAVTKRSDSASLVAGPTAPSWVSPATHDAYFWGPTMTNVHFHTKDMIGTLRGSTLYIRGHDRSGALQSLDEMSDTAVHECSHFLVSEYGEMPNTTNAGDFDRYADEFRAYWVEGRYAERSPAERARRIRRHLVGVASDPNSGYPALHSAYFAPAPNTFRTQADAMTRPRGFNLGNSIRLHRLWELFNAHAAGTATVEQLVRAVANLRPAERDEAEGSTLIQGLVTAIGGQGARRVRAALSAPTTEEYTRGLNPTGSGAVRRFLGAVIRGEAGVLKHNYTRLSTADKQAMSRNPAFLVFLDHHLLDSGLRAGVFGMIVTGRTGQLDAVVAFVRALRAARGQPDSATLPSDVEAALAALNERTRWVFFSWGRQGAMRDYVEPLPPRMEASVRARLRQ